MNPLPTSTNNPKLQSQKSHSMYGAHGVILQTSLLVVIAALVFWFLLLPKQSAVSAQRTELSDLKDTEESTAAMLTKLNNLVQVLDRSQDQVSKLDSLLPLDSRPTKIQVMLQRYVETSGMGLANINVDYPAEESIIAAGDPELLKDPFSGARTRRIASVTLQITGQMNQFEALLKNIETGSRLFDIKSIDIKGQEDGGLAIRLNLETYFYLP